MRYSIPILRTVGISEGISFLVLLLIAMPLKYLAHKPLAVQVFGSIHGFLFVLFVLAALWAAWTNKWSMIKLGVVLVASLIPFGPFVIDRHLRSKPQKDVDQI